MSSNQAMRREVFFSGDSPYDVLVRGNVLLHRQASQELARRLRSVVEKWPVSASVEVLDLACGGFPDTLATVMAGFPQQHFRYTGVDINKEQVEKARQYPFADNVESEVLEGSAWDLLPLFSRAPFDLIFVGLNWHHGTPEELWFMARQAHALLTTDGCLVNHDCYRPDDAPHVSRPENSDEDGKRCALALVDSVALNAAKVPQLNIQALPAGTSTEWRSDLITRLERGYLDNGGSTSGARILTAHSARRDFPLSVADALHILEMVGFEVVAHRYDPLDGPLAKYLAMLTALPRRADGA